MSICNNKKYFSNTVTEIINMIQLYLGAHAIILPVDLALKIVFCYHKSGKYVNTYLDDWW